MTQNTIYNKYVDEPVSAIAYNMVLAMDNPNDLDAFTMPTTVGATAQQMSDFTYRSMSVATKIDDCRLAETSALTVTYSNGTAGVGATLTNAGAQAALTIDSVAAVVGNRVLIGGQASSFQNGIYTVTGIGSASTNWVLTRATDYDQAAEILIGTFTNITAGTVLAGKKFVQVTNGITVGTTAIIFKAPNSVLLSSNNAMYLSGAFNAILTLTADSFLTLPSGTKAIYGTGDAASYGGITNTSTLTQTIGTGSATVKAVGLLHNSHTTTGNITTGEDDLITYPMPASTLVVTGQVLEYEVAGTFANNADAKTVKVYFGTTLVCTLAAAASIAGSWRAKISVRRTGASAQSWVAEATRTITGGGAAIANTSGTCTETETGIITLKSTGEGVTTNDIIQGSSTVKSF